MGVGGERRAASGQQTLLRDQDIQRLPAVTLESVIVSLSVASSIKDMAQPQSSVILMGTRDPLGTESHWVH